jgi:hypothetical protein
MSKKTNKTCKLEQVNTTPNSNKTASESLLITETKSPAQPSKPNPPSSLTKTQKASPRMTPNTSTTNLTNVTAEKRGK